MGEKNEIEHKTMQFVYVKINMGQLVVVVVAPVVVVVVVVVVHGGGGGGGGETPRMRENCCGHHHGTRSMKVGHGTTIRVTLCCHQLNDSTLALTTMSLTSSPRP